LSIWDFGRKKSQIQIFFGNCPNFIREGNFAIPFQKIIPREKGDIKNLLTTLKN
jgi:hypothetical protein